MSDQHEAVADAAMDAKMREIWAAFDKLWMRRRLRALLPPTRIDTLGCAFVVHPRDNYTEFRMWEDGRPPEHEGTLAVMRRLAGRPATIVDVGANAGAFGLPVLRAAGPGARALMIEPNPEMRARLAVNIALNGLDGAQILDCAVGEAEGRARLHFPRNGNLGQGRMMAYARPGAAGDEVRVRPLATCLAEAGFDRVDFLKVDVEGLEDRVICPLLDAGGPLPGLIHFEIAHEGTWTLPLLETLARTGYRQVAVFGQNVLFERAA